MVNKKISKNDAKEKITNFFENIRRKTPAEIKKIKRLAANQKISLKNEKKLFCSSCLTPFLGGEKIRIKNGFLTTTCRTCGEIKRVKI